ncbi:MAG: tape measure protein [Ligilactobacillus ruminis]|nr:tape measure protein [Ligilactobacillus ruminis]
MAEFGLTAVLKAYDSGFTKGLENAKKGLDGLKETSEKTGIGAIKFGALFAVASKLTSAAMGVVKDSLSGAISRFDTLNKYPVVMKALGYSTRDVAKSSQILQKGIDGLPTSLDEITSSAQQLAPLTGSASKAAQSAVALNDAFLASGASAGDASRGLTQYTQMLSTGKVDLMSYRTLMETMPIALRKVANSFGLTGKSAEMDLYAKLQDGSITIDQLNDKFIELDQAQNGFASLAHKNSAGIGTSFENLKNSVVKNLSNMLTYINDGFSDAGFGSIAKQLDNLKYVINDAFTAIGPVVSKGTEVALGYLKKELPTIKQVCSDVKNALMSFFNFLENHKDGVMTAAKVLLALWSAVKVGKGVVGTILSVASGYSKLVTAISALGEVAGTAVGVLTTIAGGIAKVGAAIAGFAAANPMVLIIAAIAAVVTALTLFFTKTKLGQQLWSQFTSFLSDCWNGIKEVASSVWDAVAEFITSVPDKVKGVWNGVTSFFSGIWSGITDMANSAVDAIQNAWSGVKEWFGNLWQSIVDAVSPYWQSFLTSIQPVIDAFKNLWDALKEFFQTLWDAITSAAQAVWNGFVTNVVNPVVEGVKSAWQGISDFFSSLWQTITGFASTVWNGFVTTVVTPVVEFFKSVWSGITDFFSSLWQGIVDFASGIWNGFVSTVVSPVVDGVKSAWSGITDWWSGLWNGIKDVASNIWNGIKTVIGIAINAVKTVISNVANVIKTLWKDFWNGIKVIVSGVWNAIITIVSACINAVAKIIRAITNAIKGNWKAAWNDVKSAFSGIWRSLSGVVRGAFGGVISAISNGMGKAINAVRSKANSLWSAGKNFVMGFVKGIRGAIGSAVSAAAHMAKSALKAAKSALGIHSPSRVMRDQVGYYAVAGFANGLTDNKSMVAKAAQALADCAVVKPASDWSAMATDGFNTAFAQAYSADVNMHSTITVEVPVNLDGKTIAKVTAQPLEDELNRRQARNQRLYGNR